MAASVRIEDEAFSDRRYDRLAKECGLADADHARGKMAVLWRQCTLEGRHVLPIEDVEAVLGHGAVNALVAARLGEKHPQGIRIRGTRGRIEWLKKLRENGAKGGRPKKTKCKPSGFADQNPPAPAPAPAPMKEINTGGLGADASTKVEANTSDGPPPKEPPPHERQPPTLPPERHLAQRWLHSASVQSGRKPTLEELADSFADMIEHGDTVEWLTSQIDTRRKSDTWGMFLVSLKQARQAREPPGNGNGRRRKTPEEIMAEAMAEHRRNNS